MFSQTRLSDRSFDRALAASTWRLLLPTLPCALAVLSSDGVVRCATGEAAALLARASSSTALIDQSLLAEAPLAPGEGKRLAAFLDRNEDSRDDTIVVRLESADGYPVLLTLTWTPDDVSTTNCHQSKSINQSIKYS